MLKLLSSCSECPGLFWININHPSLMHQISHVKRHGDNRIFSVIRDMRLDWNRVIMSWDQLTIAPSNLLSVWPSLLWVMNVQGPYMLRNNTPPWRGTMQQLHDNNDFDRRIATKALSYVTLHQGLLWRSIAIKFLWLNCNLHHHTIN